MSIKLTIFRNGDSVISDMQELVESENQKRPHAYLLDNPHKVMISEKNFLTEEEVKNEKHSIDVLLQPWIVLSADKRMLLPVDCVMTIVEPITSIKKMYIDKMEKINKGNLDG